eukprot:4729340-Pyramimonas_sp.AAC.1
MKADLSAEIHADEDIGSSTLDVIIDPPEDFLTHPDYDPEDNTRWILQSYDYRIYRWTSELLVDSPMIK